MSKLIGHANIARPLGWPSGCELRFSIWVSAVSQQSTASLEQESVRINPASLFSGGNSERQEFISINLFIKAHSGEKFSLIRHTVMCNYTWMDWITTGGENGKNKYPLHFTARPTEFPPFWLLDLLYYKRQNPEFKRRRSLLFILFSITNLSHCNPKTCGRRRGGGLKSVLKDGNQLANVTAVFPKGFILEIKWNHRVSVAQGAVCSATSWFKLLKEFTAKSFKPQIHSHHRRPLHYYILTAGIL